MFPECNYTRTPVDDLNREDVEMKEKSAKISPSHLAPGAANENVTTQIFQNLKLDDSKNEMALRLRCQIEFYLGNSNLVKDKFLR